MTNIWTESFKEIRNPHFVMEDPYTLREKKEKEEKEKEEPGEKDESEYAGEDQEDKYKKSGKKSKDYDKDGTVEDEADEYAGVKDKAIKKAMKMKEERDLHSKKDKNKKLDVKGNVHNKIDVNPNLKEEFESWVNDLLDEGYDLSEYTWEELQEIYEATGTEIPPKGDAERHIVDSSSKRAAAQAQIRKELADVQLAKAQAKTKSSTNESVIVYLYNRYSLSE